MKRLALLMVLISLGLLLIACGGSSGETEPTSAPSNTTSESAPTPTEKVEATTLPQEEASTEEEVVEEEVTEEESAEEETPIETQAPQNDPPPAAGFGDLPLTGTDSTTGLQINPERISAGETVIIRGKVISMNLTPTTSPEYLVQISDGTNFRFRGQDLTDTYFIDGTQIKPFQFQLGMLAQATVTLAADAGPTDLATTTDFTLISMGE